MSNIFEKRVRIVHGLPYLYRKGYDPETEKTFEESELLGDFLLPYLLEEVELVETTLGEFLTLFIEDSAKDVYNTLLMGAAGSVPDILDRFAVILAQPVVPDPDVTPLHYVEVFVYGVDLHAYSDGSHNKAPNRLGFHGWGPWDLPPEEEPFEGGWAVEFSPINELAHLPLKINPEFVVYNRSEDVCKFDMAEISLLDVLYAIVWEMTFVGVVESRTEICERLPWLCDDPIDGE